MLWCGGIRKGEGQAAGHGCCSTHLPTLSLFYWGLGLWYNFKAPNGIICSKGKHFCLCLVVFLRGFHISVSASATHTLLSCSCGIARTWGWFRWVRVEWHQSRPSGWHSSRACLPKTNLLVQEWLTKVLQSYSCGIIRIWGWLGWAGVKWCWF